MKILSFGIRNVGRNRTRSLVTTTAMAFAGFIMVFYVSLMEGMINMMENNIVSLNLGDIQIHAEGYREDPDLYKRINNYREHIEKLKSSGYFASPRLYGFGLAASGSTSSGVLLRGLDLEHEITVTQLHRHIMDGSWLDDTDLKGVVIGNKLARTLDTKPGDEIVIVGQAADGSMANDIYYVRGILKSIGDGLDRSGFFMVDKALRDLMVLPDGAHEIVIKRHDNKEDLVIATKRVSAIAPDLEVMNWRQLKPLLARIFDISTSALYFMYIIAYAAIGMVIMNAMLMSVFERIHELGVMKAIGVTPYQISALIFTEALFQTTVASVVAILFGLPLSLYYEKYGLDLSKITSGGSIHGVAFDPIWYCHVTIKSVMEPIIFLFAIVVLSVIYPAVKAALIRPVQAIYYR